MIPKDSWHDAKGRHKELPFDSNKRYVKYANDDSTIEQSIGYYQPHGCVNNWVLLNGTVVEVIRWSDIEVV